MVGDAGAHASGTAGQMGVTANGWVQNFEGWGLADVGIEFGPIPEPGLLSIWSAPSYSFFWQDYAWGAVAGSHAYLRLAVTSYNLDGFPTGLVLGQRTTLWDHTTYAGPSGPYEGTVRDVPLSLNCPVDPEHSYVIWVQCYLRAFSDRKGGSSGVMAALQVTVPAIVWQLT